MGVTCDPDSGTQAETLLTQPALSPTIMFYVPETLSFSTANPKVKLFYVLVIQQCFGVAIHDDSAIFEDITIMDVQLWADVCKLALSGSVACILSGDFAQFPAILEHWCGVSIPEGQLEDSHMVRDLAGSNRLTLSVNRRSDEFLFDFHTAVSSARPIAEAVREARILFPRTERAADTTYEAALR